MNALQVGAIVGVLTAVGCCCFVLSLRRAPSSLAAARLAMTGSGPGDSSVTSRRWIDELAAGALGRWVTVHFGSGLTVLGLTAVDVATRVIISAGGVFFAVLALAVALMTFGMAAVSPLWLLLALACAAMAAWVSLHDVAGKVARRRRALQRVSNDFVQLVAVGLTTDQSVEEAIGFALAVGDTESFDSLRREISTAPQRGVAVWEALAEFGRRYEIREIGELAASVERQGLQGVSIGETVASLAVAMRAKALDDLEREADRANANLSGPTVGFVVATIVFLAYPLAQRISQAFGG